MQYQVHPTDQTQENEKNFFGPFDHSKMHFYEFRTILPDVATLTNLRKHLALSQHAISSQSTDLTQVNDKKPLFWHFGSFKYAFL